MRYLYPIALAGQMLNHVISFIEAEKACDLALGQHRSVKGYWRRAQARKGQGRIDDAIGGERTPFSRSLEFFLLNIVTGTDLHGVLCLQHTNKEAFDEMCALAPNPLLNAAGPSSSSATASSSSSSSAAAVASTSSSPSSSSTQPQPSASASASSKPWHEHLAPRVKPLPFARSPTDDRKLKISSIPVTVEIPVEFLAVPTTGPDKGKGAPGAGEASGRMISQTFSYPCWERYMVQRVSEQ